MMRATLQWLVRAAAAGAVTVAGVALIAQQSGPAVDAGTAATATRSSKVDLTPDNVSRLLALVRPQDGEWRHLRVRWLTDVVAARQRAAAEDKPILICYTGGAGYNEPLGVC